MPDISVDSVYSDTITFTLAANAERILPGAFDYVACIDASLDNFEIALNGASFFVFNKGLKLKLPPGKTADRFSVRNLSAAPQTFKFIRGVGDLDDNRLTISSGLSVSVDTTVTQTMGGSETVQNFSGVVTAAGTTTIFTAGATGAKVVHCSIHIYASPASPTAMAPQEIRGGSTLVAAFNSGESDRNQFPVLVPAGTAIQIITTAGYSVEYRLSVVSL